MTTTRDFPALAKRWLGARADQASELERVVLERVEQRQIVSRDMTADIREMSFGDRIADRVASFGGSWTFILMFIAFLVLWTAINTHWLLNQPVDPFPYIFLNLLLSMVAALQAPVIMMSQNRQSARDRAMAEHDYEVNLKAEIEIMALHEKLEAMRAEQLEAILAGQQQQLKMITELMQSRGATPS